jgi:hypothetical protein
MLNVSLNYGILRQYVSGNCTKLNIKFKAYTPGDYLNEKAGFIGKACIKGIKIYKDVLKKFPGMLRLDPKEVLRNAAMLLQVVDGNLNFWRKDANCERLLRNANAEYFNFAVPDIGNLFEEEFIKSQVFKGKKK